MSQYNEHIEILKHFEGRREPGTFLDIGAFDGTTFSNTKPLADLGWSGVCVEPNPPAFCHLMRTYEGNPRVRLVNAAVVPLLKESPRVLELHCNTADAYSADMASTFDVKHRDKFAGYPFRSIWSPVIRCEDLKGFGLFDFINIDVEGLNLDVLHNATDVFAADMWCVELDPALDLLAFEYCLGQAGCMHFQIVGGNLLGWR